ncbi:hypothetical protein AKO1_006057 [Acrasis kona]|uniref:tRNAHis guanylyltransferase catalytic domain-containing protein n=1 Tax=Acrasis kona TaxID=1008807 RepID=A0AAW2YHI3_9EUKA
MSNKGVYDVISERMKNYENDQGPLLDDTKPFMMRLDGHKFSTFASPFRKPFDDLLHNVMVATANDLLTHYHCTTAYTQSDEITLVFPALNNKDAKEGEENIVRTPLHSGRVLKLCTLASGYCTARFNFHCLRLADSWPSEAQKLVGASKGSNFNYERIQSNLRGGVAYFDARAFNVESEQDLLDNVMWRSKFDCRRNSMNNLGRMYFSSKQMNGVKNRELNEMLLQKNVNFNDWPLSFRYGTFIKKELTERVGTNPITGKSETVQRAVVKCYALEPRNEKEYLDMLLYKYWNQVDPKVTQTKQVVE